MSGKEEWPKRVSKKDLRTEYYRGSGPGGQHRNKSDTCCRITHIPTGIVGKSEEHKSQGQNKKTAWKRLADKLVPMMKMALSNVPKPDVSERVRTYHDKRNSVVDHRVDGRKWRMTDILDGDLDDIIREVSLAKSRELGSGDPEAEEDSGWKS